MSAGTPPHAELMAGLVFDGDWRAYDFSHQRIAQLVDALRGDYLGGPDTVIRSPGNMQRPRLQPHAEGLIDRLWYGGQPPFRALGRAGRPEPAHREHRVR